MLDGDFQGGRILHLSLPLNPVMGFFTVDEYGLVCRGLLLKSNKTVKREG